jgi:hypothetical protein
LIKDPGTVPPIIYMDFVGGHSIYSTIELYIIDNQFY